MTMLGLTTFLRSLARHRLYAAINIGGLALGIAVFLVLGLYVRFETGYERWLPGHDVVWLAETRWNFPGMSANGVYPNSMGGLLDQLRQDFPGVEGTRVWTPGATVIRNGLGTAEDLWQVDRGFFSVLPLPMAAGSSAGVLDDPANLVLTETTARRYFPGGNAIGQPLTLNVNGRTGRYRVAAVMRDLPRDTELQKLSMLVRLPDDRTDANLFGTWTHWGSAALITYLRFPDRAAADALAARLDTFADRRGAKDLGPHASQHVRIELLPIADFHLQKPADRLRVTTLGLVGVLTLLIAVVNYVNLATARSGLRAREIAMRKVLGAPRATLIRQFLGEAVATVGLAALIGLALAELGLPGVNAAGDLPLRLHYLGAGGVLLPTVGLVILVGLAAGLYPALLLSSFPAASVLASARAPGGGRAGTRLREGLVIFQFALAISFIVGTAVLVAQTLHVRNTDLGFPREGLVEVPSLSDVALTDGQRRTLLDAIRALPNVNAAAMADTAVGDDSNTNNNNIVVPGRPGDGPNIKQDVIGPGFFRVHGVRPIAGRLFDPSRAADDTHGRKYNDPWNIVLNQAAVPLLGFRSPADAIGKTVGGGSPRTIIGVVPDLRYYSPRTPVAPTYYSFTTGVPSMAAFASVRFRGDPQAMVAALRTTWRRIAPEVPFDARLATTSLARYYKQDDQAARLFGIGAGLAVLIGCVGLWGLASFNTARRVKEIGIRKVLGASTADVVTLLVGQFLRPVAIANLVAWPIAYLAMRTWLAGFDDRIALSPLFFLGASGLALAVAVLTVLTQSLRAARAAPAWALRHE